jgi:hypothetical protein
VCGTVVRHLPSKDEVLSSNPSLKRKGGGRGGGGEREREKEEGSWVPVAHVCNPSYSGSKDQEDRGKLNQGK